MSNIEEQLKTLIDGSGETIVPQSRAEIILDKAINKETDYPEPQSIFEDLLIDFLNNGDKASSIEPTSRIEAMFKAKALGEDLPTPANEFENLFGQFLMNGGGESWDYSVENVDFNGTNYILTEIVPNSSANINKSYAMEISISNVYQTTNTMAYILAFPSKGSTSAMGNGLFSICEQKSKPGLIYIPGSPYQQKVASELPILETDEMKIVIERDTAYNISFKAFLNGNMIYEFSRAEKTQRNDPITVGAGWDGNNKGIFHLNYFRFKWIEG